jgi:hypothetical protein
MLSLFCLRLIFGNANPVAFNDVSPMYNIDQLFRPYDFPWDYKSNLGAPIFLTGNTVYNVPLLGLSVLFGSVTLAHKILLVLLIGFAGFGFYLAFSYLLKSRSAGFIAGLVMLFCPFILTRWISGHNTILLVYMVLPYALLVFLMMMRVGGKHSIVLCGLLTGLMIYISPQIAYLFLLFAILYGVFDLIFSRRVAIFSCFKIRLLQFSILIGITLLVAFPFFYPLLMVNLPVYATRAEEMAVSFLSPATSSMLLSQVALVVFIFASLTFLFWKQLIGGLFGKVKNDANVYSSAIGNLVSVRFAEILLFAMLGLLSMCIICLALFYAPGYYWLFNNIPGFGMFREVDKFLLFTALSVAFFLGLITEAFKRYVTKLNLSVFVRKSLPIILISLIVLSSSWPYLSGDLNGAVKTVEIPESYQNLDSWLRAQNDTFRVAFLSLCVGN